jgi:hypothetical protein
MRNYLKFWNVSSSFFLDSSLIRKKLPGIKFVIPKDETKNYSKVIQFIEGDKSLLSQR